MIRYVGWFLVAVAPSAASARETSCLGPADAERFVVYLHGVDGATPGPQERQNRKRLARIGRAHGIRFALPRAREACGDDACWGWALDPAERGRAAAAVAEATARCFPPDARFGVVGFSSGGYLLLSWLRHCELGAQLPGALWGVAVGSAMLVGPIEAEPADLSGCGAVTLLVGDADTTGNADPAENYLRRLQAKNAQVERAPFPGGHELPAAALEDEIVRRFEQAP